MFDLCGCEIFHIWRRKFSGIEFSTLGVSIEEETLNIMSWNVNGLKRKLIDCDTKDIIFLNEHEYKKMTLSVLIVMVIV